MSPHDPLSAGFDFSSEAVSRSAEKNKICRRCLTCIQMKRKEQTVQFMTFQMCTVRRPIFIKNVSVLY